MATAYFAGGPLDGRREVYPDDDVPSFVEAATLDRDDLDPAAPPDTPLPIRTVLYKQEPGRTNNLVRYVFVPPQG